MNENISEKHFCPNCGVVLESNVNFCSNCGKSIQSVTESTLQPPNQAINVNVTMPPQQIVTEIPVSPRSKGMAAFLCFFFGTFGFHKFYVGNIGAGIIYLLTFGLLGLGPFVDFFVILAGGCRDVKGRLLVN